MYEFWYDYFKPNYLEKEKLCNINTDGFIVYIKTEANYADIPKVLKEDLILQIMNQKGHINLTGK